MKIFFIGNCIYLPFDNSDMKNTKYVSGSITGDLFLNDIYSEQEIRDRHPEIKTANNLHDLCKQWGNRM